MWKDCIDTANESADPETIEKLLRFFCDTSEKECFCAALYTCFMHVNPDVVLELGWVNGYHNFIMPFFIQTFRQTHLRLKELERRTAPKKEEKTSQDEIAGTYGGLSGFGGGMLMLENGGGIPAPMAVSPSGGQHLDMSSFGVPGPGMVAPGMQNGGMPQMGMPGM